MKKITKLGFFLSIVCLTGCKAHDEVQNCSYKLIFSKISPDAAHTLVVYSETCDLGITSSYANIASIRESSEWQKHGGQFPVKNALVSFDAGGDSISRTSDWQDNRTVIIKLDHNGRIKKFNESVLGVGFKLDQ